ncbi:succinyl-CoA synthetase subunit beta [Jannaschia sp. LMIT008]|uniref:succinyl-CoA synthetase subunit beta n=1 Tax=Jannaschia maritima TaxID=3032585 RepID=UPI002811B0B5|nr:succinyl-CoA synthetase subunit beta [Jannaschia sp. LMIT008]
MPPTKSRKFIRQTVWATTIWSCSILSFPAVAQTTNPLSAFAAFCFDPHLTATTAQERIVADGTRLDFYDAMPFSAPNPTFVTVGTQGRPRTPGTDRRCEVSFDGIRGADAVETVLAALADEGIDRDAPLPVTHADAALPGTLLLAARYLNPNRIAVVHAGTRMGPDDVVETFASVERLTPQASAEAAE